MKSISNSIENSFVLYKKHFKSYAYAFLLIAATFFVTIFLSMFVMFGNNTIKTLSAITSDTTLISSIFANTNSVSIILASIIALIGFGASYAMIGGVVGFTHMLLKRKKNDTTHAMLHVARERGVDLVFTRLLSIAFIFLTFASILFIGEIVSIAFNSVFVDIMFVSIDLIALAMVGALFLTVDQYVVIEKARPWTALTKAYEFGKANFLDLFLLVVLFAVTSNILSLIPGFGFLINLFVLTPIAVITYTYFYLNNR